MFSDEVGALVCVRSRDTPRLNLKRAASLKLSPVRRSCDGRLSLELLLTRVHALAKV
uniref:Uncharacterized protein n=1 Tax=Anguilla anguilla TaxID=7936 RepID=A0A0E9WLR2_ANGAN